MKRRFGIKELPTRLNNYLPYSRITDKTSKKNICVNNKNHLLRLSFLATALSTLPAISFTSFCVNLLFAVSLSIMSKSSIFCEIVFLTTSLHLISEYCFIFVCRSSGIAKVIFVIFYDLMWIDVITH